VQQKVGDTMSGSVRLARAGAAETDADLVRTIRVESRLDVPQMRLIWPRLPGVERMRVELAQPPRVSNSRLVAGLLGFGFQLIASEPDCLRVRGIESLP
jgi:hypothetical protein